ncbi:MAG: hypothetical protein AB7O73_11325 [Bacteroidia bacterium]
MNLKFFAYFIIFFTMISCEPKYKTLDTMIACAKESKRMDDTLICESQRCFSRIMKSNSQSLRITYNLPEHLKKGEFFIVYSGNLRTNNAFSEGSIALIIEGANGQLIHWGAQHIRYHVYETDTWCKFSDSIKIKYEDWQEKYHRIHVFPFLGNCNFEKFDVDTLKVTIKEKVS